MQLPVIGTDEVFHIGKLIKEEKYSQFKHSLEGHCLSVSHCPEAWRQIAALGGLPVWGLKRQQGCFLDMQGVIKDTELCSIIRHWGLTNGYVTEIRMWKAWMPDEFDDNEWSYFLCQSQEAAENEIDDINVLRPNDEPRVEPILVLGATLKLWQTLRMSPVKDIDALDYLIMVWCDISIPALDGVWWDECYAPELLSAPRGGIFPSRLARWNRLMLNPNQVPYDLADKHLPLVSRYLAEL